MPYYTMDESYTEYAKGKRKIVVFAESLQDASDGNYEFNDIIEEYGQDAETTDTHPHYETLKEEPNLAFPDGEEE
jgi:hypothetical protein